jgi:hypothetical protein
MSLRLEFSFSEAWSQICEEEAISVTSRVQLELMVCRFGNVLVKMMWFSLVFHQQECIYSILGRGALFEAANWKWGICFSVAHRFLDSLWFVGTRTSHLEALRFELWKSTDVFGSSCKFS